MKTIVRVIYFKEQETPFVRATIRELSGLVDSIVITSPKITHTGFESSWQPDFKKLLDGIDLRGTDFVPDVTSIPGHIPNARDSKGQHFNEFLTRVSFLNSGAFKSTDIVLALHADEVPYGSMVQRALGQAKATGLPWRLPFHQFFYRPNWLWEDYSFESTVVSPVWIGKFPRFGFRDLGFRAGGGKYGVHFSWNLTIDQMREKLGQYAHASDYGHLNEKELLEKAVRQREYPFDPSTTFSIRELDSEELSRLIPSGFKPEYPAVLESVMGSEL